MISLLPLQEGLVFHMRYKFGILCKSLDILISAQYY
jgi:hypothetical protein